MFDATFLGITSTQFLEFSTALFATTAAFVFLYLLNIPLTKLPFIANLADYKPPTWLVPWFAGISLFLLSASTSTGWFLRTLKAYPSADAFYVQYNHTEPGPEIPEGLGKLTDAGVTVSSEEGNFGIYANGWMLFAAEPNCGFVFVCNGLPDAVNSTRSLALLASLPGPISPAFYTPGQFYKLPHDVSIMRYVAPGDNFVDVHSGYAGMGNYNLHVTLKLKFEKSERTKEVSLDGNTCRRDLPKYRTYDAYISHRVCDRTRVTFSLPDSAF